MSILLPVWVFVASFVTTLVLVGVVPRIAKLLFVALVLHRKRHEIAAAIGVATQPDEIHLRPAGAEPWEDRPAAARLVRPLEQAGFRSAGVFAIDEMEGVLVQLFAHPDERLVAAAYEHPVAGHWIDIVERRSDGTSTTWTTAAPSGLDSRPGHPQVHVPGATPDALLARVRRERGPGPAELVMVAEVEALFERAYAEETAWRKGKGVSREEVRHIEQAMRPAA